MCAFQLVQTLYWVSLSTWFGGVLFVAVAAPIIFRTVREWNPILPTVLSVNLENQHASLLAGAIVGNILRTLSTIALGCAGMLLVTVVSQWVLMDRSTGNVLHGILRSVFLVGAVVLTVYDRYVTWPKVWKYREEYIAHADEPEVANPAKDQFDRYHRESMWLMFAVLILLSLMIVFSNMVSVAKLVIRG
ncbi:MAG: DUF4149 domain-containing protein [Planctomycetota bacterium]|nr:DUF4149 domain-containing protein [Planctomycetota bacterium]